MEEVEEGKDEDNKKEKESEEINDKDMTND